MSRLRLSLTSLFKDVLTLERAYSSAYEDDRCSLCSFAYRAMWDTTEEVPVFTSLAFEVVLCGDLTVFSSLSSSSLSSCCVSSMAVSDWFSFPFPASHSSGLSTLHSSISWISTSNGSVGGTNGGDLQPVQAWKTQNRITHIWIRRVKQSEEWGLLLTEMLMARGRRPVRIQGCTWLSSLFWSSVKRGCCFCMFFRASRSSRSTVSLSLRCTHRWWVS